jgi:tetratricopeptide (TPR) repeat protein
VFFARITLEDKLGQEYEPYIFAALNSAKVMLVVGTKPEHFNAVWVKNEWSRFLALTQNDRSRLLIPCYRDMDAYDIPDELSALQSQDMSKVGFLQDILRGVKKVLDASKTSAAKPASAVGNVAAAPGIESLMKRGWLFLEDKDWQQADAYFDKVLDIDPEYAPAYIGKLCVELKKQKEESLAGNEGLLSAFGNFQKAVRFADADYKAILEGYNNQIREQIYVNVLKEKNRASSEQAYKDLAERFQAMDGYKDSTELANECANKYFTLKKQREEREQRKEQERNKRQREEERRQIEEEQRQIEENAGGMRRAALEFILAFVVTIVLAVLTVIMIFRHTYGIVLSFWTTAFMIVGIFLVIWPSDKFFAKIVVPLIALGSMFFAENTAAIVFGLLTYISATIDFFLFTRDF